MTKFFSACIFSAILFAPSVSAQDLWEMGALGGYVFDRNATITNHTGQSASTSFNNGAVWGFVAGASEYKYLGGEASYLFRGSDIKANSGGTNVTFGAQTHFVDFRFLVHFANRENRLRPFVAVGGGVAVYEGTGTESSSQPLNNIIALTHTRDVKPMFSAAAGLKYRITNHVGLRFEFRDYMTSFPDQVIAPVPGSSSGGWLHNFAPMVGIVGVF